MFRLKLMAISDSGQAEFASQKFQELFETAGLSVTDNEAELGDLNVAAAITFHDIINEMLVFLDIADIEADLVLLNSRTSRAVKITDVAEFDYFVRESIQLQGSQGATPADLPYVGNFWGDVIGEGYEMRTIEPSAFNQNREYARYQPLANPYDIDDPLIPEIVIPEDPELRLPKSEKFPTSNAMMVQDSHFITVRNRLAKYGVSFPILNEQHLKSEIDRLIKMNEVEDADIIDLIKGGTNWIGDKVGKTIDDHNELSKQKKQEKQDRKASEIKDRIEALESRVEDLLKSAGSAKDPNNLLSQARSAAASLKAISPLKGRNAAEKISDWVAKRKAAAK